MENPKSVLELEVYRDQTHVGKLSRTSTGCELTFAPTFLSNPQYPSLSYKIRKSESGIRIGGVNLPPFFAGLLPEGLRLNALVRRLKTSEDDLFSLFAAVGSRVIGDVYVQGDLVEFNPDKSFPRFPKLKEIDFHEYFEALLKSDASQGIEDSFAGVQEKISASMISFPVRMADAHQSYILKLNPKDKPRLIENEFNCMELARKCKMRIPVLKKVQDKNGNTGLLVQRFDRQWDAAQKRFQMIHQEDGCQILDRYPSEKYRISLNEIVESAVGLVSAPQATVLQLLKLYCFSYLIGNGDLHAKNISFCTDPRSGAVGMTPVYDLISTILYGDQKMAIKLDGRDDNLKHAMVVDFGKRFSVPEIATTRMLDQLTLSIEKHANLLKSIPADTRKLEQMNRMVEKRLGDLTKP